MNYARVREKLKEKNKALKGLTGSERERAEKSIIESGDQDESGIENGDDGQNSESESENSQEEEKEKVSQPYQGKKRGPKPRK